MLISRTLLKISVGVAVVIASLSQPVAAQDPTKAQSDEDLRREVRELKQGQEAIQKELQEIKKLLLAREAGKPVRPETISIASRPFRGTNGARIVMVEFSDYQCPFCGRFYRETLPLLDKEYIQAGKIKYVFNNLPLDDLHPVAFKAAEAAECAGEQGKFWDLHGRFFGNQSSISNGDMSSPAKAIGLDMAQFDKCVQSGKTEAVVRAGVQQATSLGIQSTPSFVIGLVNDKNPNDGNVKILGVINGAYPYPVFKQALDKALGQ